MPVIELQTYIKANRAIVFDLSRSIDLHKISTQHTHEEAIAGKITGLIELHESVTWKAKHLGVYQTLTSKITAMEKPQFFEDQQEKGIFSYFIHGHFFEIQDDDTLMIDRFEYQSPLGFLGRLADKLFLEKYMTQLLQKRNAIIKEFAESGRWKEVL
ncbi:hypothetical protein SAMN05216480_12113 [Pustulibacterium marinum]|uniref:Ligand-binding SRPBCC domain-containing protein n=1 Tax=Pustulibacterium marinum TaxID=1224947 RepID=A0A1I7ISJ5_9FLAO|nr:SRPBCC family protein [Pustulibacterium marinum]SFU75919.1 hypothetical protein SAMN05216480_12113 [Pustulibacterium marinum]